MKMKLPSSRARNQCMTPGSLVKEEEHVVSSELNVSSGLTPGGTATITDLIFVLKNHSTAQIAFSLVCECHHSE